MATHVALSFKNRVRSRTQLGCGGMDSRPESTVRGTDTTASDSKARAPAAMRRYLASLQSEANLDPNDALKDSLTSHTRRKAGAFFTEPDLADTLVAPWRRELQGDATVMDPACGSGNLLIAATRHFKRARDRERLLEHWQDRIFGRDLFEEFVLSARLRVFRAAQPKAKSSPSLGKLFTGIQTGCSLSDADAYAHASHVVMNPPFTLVKAPEGCEWRTGRVSSAALFLEAAVQNCAAGTRIAALLPDVLRSGSGYESWREMIESRLKISSTKIVGRFARWADVDVFLLHGVVRRHAAKTTSFTWSGVPESRSSCRLGDLAKICVGAVVDYRSPKEGSWKPYLTVDDAPGWETVSASGLPSRRFAGTVFAPPFVAVRRTSRAGDTHRMVGTIVTGSEPVAVENHLLVLKPHDKTLRSCKALVEGFQKQQTTDWFNERIRCRHLTVGAVTELPWPPAK